MNPDVRWVTAVRVLLETPVPAFEVQPLSSVP
jgi:hypothetical protein